MANIRLKCWVKTNEQQHATEEIINVNVPDWKQDQQRIDHIEEEAAEWKNRQIEWGYEEI